MRRVELNARLREAELMAKQGDVEAAFREVRDVLSELNEEIEALKVELARIKASGGVRE